MANLNDTATDPKKELDGVWVEFSANWYLCIARFGNPAYVKRMQSLLRPHRSKMKQPGFQASEKMAELIKRASSYEIVKGWGKDANGQVNIDGTIIDKAEDLLDDDGAVIRCEPDTVFATVRDPRYRDLWTFIEEIAADGAFYREEDIEDAAGNSRPPSSGGITSEPTAAPSKS